MGALAPLPILARGEAKPLIQAEITLRYSLASKSSMIISTSNLGERYY